ncbi:MAG: BRCT domain-containing protein [Planctomycetota bacterium]
MQYRRERLMVPMVVISTLMAIFFLLWVYEIAVSKPHLKAEVDEKDREVKKKDDNYGKLEEIVKANREIIGGKPQVVNNDLKSQKKVYEDTPVSRVWTDFLADGNLNGTGEKFESIAPWARKMIDGRQAAIAEKDGALQVLYSAWREIRPEGSEGDENEWAALPRDEQLDRFINRLNVGKQERAALKDDLQTATNRIQTLEADVVALERKLQQVIDEAAITIASLTTRAEKAEKEEKSEREARKKVQEEKEMLDTRLNAANKLNGILNDHIERLTKRTTEDVALDPDGEIVSVQTGPDGVIGAIDVGSKDGLKEGVIFEVTYEGVMKGHVQVYKVDDKMSYIRVVKLTSEANPIIAGDKVASLFFNKGDRPEFVIVGHFKTADFQYSREDIRHLVEKWGGTVTDKIGSSTTYVIVGDGEIPDKTREDIRMYNVEVIRKARLIDFLEKR